MRSLSFALAGALFAVVAGCNTVATRIREQPALFNSLDLATREKITRGEIELGFPPELVLLARGEPTERSGPAADGSGEMIWTYRNRHRDPKDEIRGGYRRRIVFDPVIRAETVVVEPIDDRLAAKLAPQSLRLTFRDGRLVTIERIPEM